MTKTYRLAGACAALAIMFAPLPGRAMESCAGTYSATLLRPLPAPLVVGLLVRDDSPRNVDLAAQFNAGLQKAGVAVAGAANVQLTLTVTISGAGGGGDGVAPMSDPDSSSSWWNGGVTQQYADESRFGGAPQAPGPGTLQLRAELRPSMAEPVAWVASLQCSLQGSDDRQLAYDMGTVIGGAIGRRVEQGSF